MPWDSRWEEDPMSLVDAEMSRLESLLRVTERERDAAIENAKHDAVMDDEVIREKSEQIARLEDELRDADQKIASAMNAADSLAHGVRELLDDKWPGQDLGGHLIKLHFLVERYEKKRRRQASREAASE